MGGKAPIYPDADGLNPRQRQFCLRYLATGNGTASAIQSGYSARSASATACELRANPKVAAYLAKHRDDPIYEVNSTMLRLREELTRTAYTHYSQNPIIQMQIARIKKIDGKTEKQINKLFPSMTAEYEVLRKMIKDHELNQARAQKLLADLDNQKTMEKIAERLEKLEKDNEPAAIEEH